MYETEVALVVLALGLAISDYAIYYMIFEKSFVNRFRSFSDALHNSLRIASEEFLEEFRAELEEESDLSDLVDFTKEWAIRQSVALDIVKSWSSISGRHRWIITFCALSVGSVGLFFLNPEPLIPSADQPMNFLNIAALMFIGEVYHVLSFLWEFSKLSSQVAKYELGEPLERMFEEEVNKAKGN